MAKFNGVAIAVTSSGRPVNIEWALSLPSLAFPVGMSAAWLLAKGSERGKQRDALAQRALDIGADYLFLIDDDTISPHTAIRDLHYELAQRPDAALIAGIYCTKEERPSPLVFESLGGGPFYNWTLGDVFECAGVGTGCMLIRTKVLNDIPKPWFVDFSEAIAGQSVEINGLTFPQAKSEGTDDLYFCKKVTEAGYKILAHGGVLPVHVDQDGKMYTLPLDSYPCKAFDAQIAQAKADGKRNLIIQVERPVNDIPAPSGN